MDSQEALALLSRLRSNVETVLLGKSKEVELALASFLAGGHILLEDIPGTGKTTLARAISASISGTFRRIQFTSDLLPQDVVGVHIFDADKRNFTFSPPPPRTWWASTSSTPTRGTSPFPPARFSRTSCSPTRSTGATPGPKAPCWRPRAHARHR